LGQLKGARVARPPKLRTIGLICYGIAEFTGLEFAGLENDGIEQEETYLHTMK